MDKLKATMALGMGSNFFTLGGMLGIWILLSRTGWVPDLWPQILIVFSLGPAFLGDALNSYVLGRIRLDVAKNWDDIQITPEGKQRLGRLHLLWRLLSFTTSASLAFYLVAMSTAPNPAAWSWVRWLFCGAFLLHMARCFLTIHAYIAPRLPSFGGVGLRNRFLAVGSISAVWLFWLLSRDAVPFGRLDMILHGGLYFLLCGAVQPLPSRYSIFSPGRVGRRKLSLEVEALTPDDIAALSPAIEYEVKTWCETLGFSLAGGIRMPLLELPLFQTCGLMLVSEDRTRLLLVLQSDVRQRVHRTILTYAGDRLFMTTDFGAPEARFPQRVTYANLPFELGAAEFLARHAAMVPEAVDLCPQNPVGALQQEVALMFAFLQHDVRAPTPPTDPDAGSSSTASAADVSPPPVGSAGPRSDVPDGPTTDNPEDSEPPTA